MAKIPELTELVLREMDICRTELNEVGYMEWVDAAKIYNFHVLQKRAQNERVDE